MKFRGQPCCLVANKKARARNPLRVDPTRTAGLRRRLVADLRRRFNRLRSRIARLLVTEDAFGLGPPSSPFLNARSLTTNNRWKYLSQPDKVKAFKEWLRTELKSNIIGTNEEKLWQRYVNEGLQKGAGRAFDDVRAPDKARAGGAKDKLDFYDGSKDEFLRSSFGRSVAIEKVKLLASRSFDDLEAVTAAMSTKIVRVLTDGLVQGKGPRDIAREMTKTVDVSRSRAETIARTECLPGETLVDTAVVRAIFRRWYEGPMVEIVTREGRKFSATPNHPMLTEDGWVAAGQLKEGDNLVRHNRKQDASSSCDPDVQRGPTTLREIFDSLSAVGVVERERTGKPDFHGDGLEGEVEILRPDRELFIGAFASISEPLVEQVFTPAGQARSRFCSCCSRLLSINEQPCLCRGAQVDALLDQSALDEAPIYLELAGDFHQWDTREILLGYGEYVNVVSELVADAAIFPSEGLAFGNGPSDTGLSENLADLFLLRSHPSGDLPLCEAGEVEFDDVLSVSIRPFAGHIYNLETPFGYYTIDELYTGNTIRAHAEGQLMAMEALGVEEVGVMVEWSTAGDEFVCPRCSSMQGVVLKLAEARGMIPAHPNCRCAFVPANVGEDKSEQKRTQSEVKGAIEEAKSKGGDDEWDAGKKIAKDRPESVLDKKAKPDKEKPDKGKPERDAEEDRRKKEEAKSRREQTRQKKIEEEDKRIIEERRKRDEQEAKEREQLARDEAVFKEEARRLREELEAKAQPFIMTTEEVQRLEKISGAKAVKEHLRKVAFQGGEVKTPGMPLPENMGGVKVGSVGYSWGQGAERAAIETIRQEAAKIEALPPKLKDATSSIILTSQKSSVKAVTKDGVVLATSEGNGVTTVYNGKPISLFDVAHEAGHTVAKEKWGSFDPPPNSDYGKAQAVEPPVTAYGATHPREDFAEACGMYADRTPDESGVSPHDQLRKNFPMKFKVLREMLE